MFSFSEARGAVLLLILSRSFVLALSFDGVNFASASNNEMVQSIQIPWNNGISSMIRSTSESPCTKELKAYSEGLEARESWAQQMWDASTKMQSGILQGNTMDLGMYWQCIRVDGSRNYVTVKGKHCMVTLRSESQSLVSSVCLPSSCNESHVLEIARSSVIISLANSSLGLELQPHGASCAEVEPAKFGVGEILTITLFSAIGGFMLICTICDFVKRNFPEKTASVDALNTLVKFSVYKNTLALFDTEVKPGTMPAINGIRFLSTCWLVALHQRDHMVFRPLVNSSEFESWSTSWSALWNQTATLGSDNFFIISGFFVSYLFSKKIRSSGKIDLPMMYLHRYIRLTPGITVVGLFAGFLSNRIASGLLWGIFTKFVTNGCVQNWWRNLLYIQNFTTVMDICIGHGWYLAADMQLFVISPLILYPLHRWPKYGLVIWGVFFLSSIIAPALVIGLNSYVMLGTGAVFDDYHMQSYTRASPYLIGLLLAYDMVTKTRRLGKVTVTLCWIGSFVIIILCCLAIRRLKTADYNLAFETACAALLRQSWSIAMAWVIYATTHGHGGVFARFLSMPIFLPLSRISFGIYLTHLIIINYNNASSKIPGIFEEHYLFVDFSGVLTLSILAATVLNVFVDTPVMIFENSLKPRPPKRVRADVVTRVNEEVTKNTRSSTEEQSQSLV